jgi:hypothetical protein
MTMTTVTLCDFDQMPEGELAAIREWVLKYGAHFGLYIKDFKRLIEQEWERTNESVQRQAQSIAMQLVLPDGNVRDFQFDIASRGPNDA